MLKHMSYAFSIADMRTYLSYLQTKKQDILFDQAADKEDEEEEELEEIDVDPDKDKVKKKEDPDMIEPEEFQ
jgi:hypothetical protein